MSAITGGSVIGVDGELAYGAPDAFVSEENNVFFPRLSLNQTGFHKESGWFDLPEGVVEYRNGEMAEVIGGLPDPVEAYIHWLVIQELEKRKSWK